MTWLRRGASALLPLATAAGATAAEPGSPEEPDPPVGVTASYTSDTLANLSGGRKRGIRQMGLLQLSGEARFQELGTDWARAFVSIQHVHGQSLSDDLVGDAQVVSNIDAPDGLRLFEAWLSVPVSDAASVKAGLIDLNGIFDVQEVGSLFIHSSHGIGPDFSQSGLNGPSIFPTTATAVVGEWQGHGFTARLGLFDAVSGDPERPRRTVVRFPGATGLLMVSEVEFDIAAKAEVQFGAWTYSSRFERLRIADAGGPPAEALSRGAYAMAEGRVGALGTRPIEAWVRAGIAKDETVPIDFYLGGGATIGNDNSRWGLAVAHARLGQPARSSASKTSTNRAETAIELTWARALGSVITVQPNLQYVINPGWNPQLRNALVAGVRLSLQLQADGGSTTTTDPRPTASAASIRSQAP